MGLNDVLQCVKQPRKASGITHEQWPDFRHGKKRKQKWGEFKTPPRPTGRRSKKLKSKLKKCGLI